MLDEEFYLSFETLAQQIIFNQIGRDYCFSFLTSSSRVLGIQKIGRFIAERLGQSFILCVSFDL